MPVSRSSRLSIYRERKEKQERPRVQRWYSVAGMLSPTGGETSPTLSAGSEVSAGKPLEPFSVLFSLRFRLITNYYVEKWANEN